MNVSNNLRDRRNILVPPHYPFASYCTETKREMKNAFTNEMIFNNIYLGPDPLRKNLAETIVPQEKMAAEDKVDEKTITESDEKPHVQVDYSPLSGITNFFSGVLSVISNAMFSRRKTNDADDSDECDEFCHNCSPEMSLPSMWHGAKITDENKILQDEISNDMSSKNLASEMGDCRLAATHCQNKLDHVRSLLNNSKPVPLSSRLRKRPKKVFVEPNSVEECFVDAFSPEDFESLANDSHIECLSPVSYQGHVFDELECPNVKLQTATPKLISEQSRVPSGSTFNTHQSVPEKHAANHQTSFSEKSDTSPTNPNEIVSPKVDGHFPTHKEEPLVCESTEIVKDVPEPEININNNLRMDVKNELVESCEDKMTKLKMLLQERNKKPKNEAANIPPHSPPKQKPLKVKDKRFKNPKRGIDKRKKTSMRNKIDEDMMFANEINSDELSSVENSPTKKNMENYVNLQKPVHKNSFQQNDVPCKEYFNEVSGRFQSSSVESDDSFQIVFNDSPRYRRQSDCESEDSFIVFEDTPDSCYTSHDVFGDSNDSEDCNSECEDCDSDSEDCDSDSDVSDSGCGLFKLTGSLSRSVNNLADDSLYVDQSEDEVDCANVPGLTIYDNANENTCVTKGLLINERKKLLQKHSPTKRVHFSTEPPKVHVMRVWLFAAKQTRQRYWEQFVVDRERFKRRINDVDMAVSWVLKPQHRSRVMFQRFMPWWNAQKRQEIADKKKREAEEKEKLEKELETEKIDSNDCGELTVKNTSTGICKPNQKEDRPVVAIEREYAELHNQSEEGTPANILDIKKMIRKKDTNKNKHQNEEIKSDPLVNLKIDKTNNDCNEESKGSGGERFGSNVLISTDINPQNPEKNAQSEYNYKESKNMSIENTKNIKNYDKNNSQIVPLDLKQEYVSGILNT